MSSHYEYKTGIVIKNNFKSRFIDFSESGVLLIRKGYSWDGPSGPAFDTKNFMRGSLIHDALYQLIRDGIIQYSKRKRADEILRDVCVSDGMSKIRAWWVYNGVRIGGGSSALPDVISAP